MDRTLVVVVESLDGLAAHPAAATADALREDGEEEALPLHVVGKTEGVAREVVAHDEAVVVVDDAVAVLVDVADVAGARDDALEMRAGSGFLVALEQAVVAQRIVGVERVAFLDDGHHVVAEEEVLALGVDDLVPVVGDVAGEVVVHGAGAEVVVQGELPAVAVHGGRVGGRGAVAEQARDRQADEDVARAVLEEVEADVQVVLQQAHVQAEVGHPGGLPLDGGIHGGEVGGRSELVAEGDALRDGDRLHVAVGADAVVTHQAPGAAELQGRDDRADGLPPGLLRHAPAQGEGREDAGTVALREIG